MRVWFLAVVFAVLMMSGGAARANAIFTWIDGGSGLCCSGQIEITNAAYFARTVDVNLDGNSGDPNPTPISADLAVQSYSFFEGQTGKFTSFGPGFYTCCHWTFDFSIVDDGLDGRIFVSDTSGYTGLSGDPALWTIDISGSDATGPGCPAAEPCTGRGRWMLTSAPAGVPEPAAGALLLAGMGALIFLAGRHRQA